MNKWATATRLLVPLLAWVLFSGTSMAEPVLSAQPPVHPQQVIQDVTDQLLVLLKDKKSQQEQGELNEEQFLADLETILDPSIDYVKFSKGVMGKYYRKSTDEQQQQFISVFKKSLFSAYATAFLTLDGETITIHPYTRPLKTKAIIKMDVYAANGTVYPISYSMHLTKDNTWKVKNVIAGPLNLGLTFKNLFLDLMSKHRDIDLAIENWSSDVASPSTTT